MNEVYIFAAKRSAIGAFGGSLSNISAPDISAEVIKNLADQEIISKVGEVIFGNVLSAGIGQNPARIASVKAGIRENVPASTINQVCGSGMRSVAIASDLLALGKRNLMVVGGMENMSQSPYLLRKHRFGNRLGHDELIDSMVNDGLWCTLTEQHMGCTAENVAYKYKISREEADVFALESQKKALQAIEKGKFTGQIVAIEVQEKKGSRIFDVDEQPRKDTAIEILLKLKPAFKEPGLVTAGNSSTINDGAAALLLGNQNAEKNYGLKPLARVVDYAVVALDPNC